MLNQTLSRFTVAATLSIALAIPSHARSEASTGEEPTFYIQVTGEERWTAPSFTRSALSAFSLSRINVTAPLVSIVAPIGGSSTGEISFGWFFPSSSGGQISFTNLDLVGSNSFQIASDTCSNLTTSQSGNCAIRIRYTPVADQPLETATGSIAFDRTDGIDGWNITIPIKGTATNATPSPTPTPTTIPTPSPTPTPTPNPSLFTLSLSSLSNTVVPLGTTGSSSTTITARLTSNSNAVSIAGKIITFTNTPEEDSGGHIHPLGDRPIGEIFPPSCITGTDGYCSARYDASEVGGIEQISANLVGFTAVTSPIVITTKVDGLFEIGNSNFYRLTGQTDSHPKNHFVASGTDFIGLASDFFDTFNATLGINDASLPFGGLFDIGPPHGPFWSKPHSLHRAGRSLDIDQCAESVISANPNDQENCPNGWIKIDRFQFERFCRFYEGAMINEATLHCEFRK